MGNADVRGIQHQKRDLALTLFQQIGKGLVAEQHILIQLFSHIYPAEIRGCESNQVVWIKEPAEQCPFDISVKKLLWKFVVKFIWIEGIIG